MWNWELIGHLTGLRYKLMWAKTRSRNGRIALFLAGYLLLIFVIAALAAGGFGAALVAVRSGKAEMVAQVVLSALYFEALIASVILGFGMGAIFSDTELRRYPLKLRERRLVRHFIGILDPFWFLILALELGLAVGLYVAGAGAFWFGLVGVLLLFVSNYLLARVLAMLVERLMRRKSGTAILLGSIVLLSMLPTMLQPALRQHRGMFPLILGVLRYTPPFGAAAAAARVGPPALYGLALLLCWVLALALLLAVLERRPARAISAQAAVVAWESPLDRVAAIFGPRDAPLVANWLRFYSRHTRFRAIYCLAVPLVTFVALSYGSGGSPRTRFAASLGAFSIAGFAGTAQFAVNQFGYVGSGFRRYALFPTDPAAALRTGSYTFLLLSAALIPVAAAAWVIFSPLPFDPRMLLMMVGSAVTGLFAFHGMALWVTLLNPRRGNYNSSFGNDLSAGGNIAVISGVLCAIFLPRALARFAPAAVAWEHWWLTIPAVVLAAAFYTVSLQNAGGAFRARRERLLATVEGRG